MKISGILYAVLSTVFIGTSTVIASVVSRNVNPVVLTLLVYLFAIPPILVFGLIQKLQLRELFKKFPGDFFKILIPRTIISQLLIIYGLSLTLAIRAGFIARLEPAFVLIFSAFLIKERIKTNKILLLVILTMGAMLFVTNGNPDIFSEVLPGDFILVIALTFLAYTYLPTARIMKKINASTVILALNLVAVIVLLPVVLIFFYPYLSINTNDLILTIAYSLTFHVFGIILWFTAMKDVKPWIVASMLSLTPVVTSVIAFFWLGQFLLPVQLLGGAIIIAATFLISRENRKT